MTISLRRSRRRVKIPNKFGDTVCTIHGKNNDKSVESEEQLQENMSNDEIEKFGGNSRVCESEIELQANNTGERRIVDDNNDGADGDKLDKTNESNHCNANKVLNKMPNVSPSPMQVNVQETVKTCVGNRDKDNTYADKDDHSRTKFDNKQGMQNVIESGSWIVNSKPMVVQKWDPSIILDRIEPNTLPLWIKIMNPPLEAWSKKGLSALASRIGTPLIMDVMTTRMCALGVSSLGYARVLVEVNAKKGLGDNIDVLYKDKINGEQCVKKVRVECDWKPSVCSLCRVFGHSEKKCHKNLKPEEKIKEKVNDMEGFIHVGNMKEKINKGRKYMQFTHKFAEKKYGNKKFEYRQKNKIMNENVGESSDKCTTQENFSTPKQNQKKMWDVGDNVIKDVRSTANKFSVLQDIEEEPFKIRLSNKEKDEIEK
ncbi:RNA-directed DNA polymerase, eukaryota, reverse transcriptase zinc-binding domain protein [Tanacetum coccineum]